MDAKNNKSSRALILLIGIPMIIVAAISLYFLLEKPICNEKIALGHAFCQLSVMSIAAILGIFGIVFLISCTAQLSPKNQAIIRNSNNKSNTIAKIIGNSLLWTIVITIFAVCIFGAMAGGTGTSKGAMAGIAALQVVIMILLIVKAVNKNK